MYYLYCIDISILFFSEILGFAQISQKTDTYIYTI